MVKIFFENKYIETNSSKKSKYLLDYLPLLEIDYKDEIDINKITLGRKGKLKWKCHVCGSEETHSMKYMRERYTKWCKKCFLKSAYKYVCPQGHFWFSDTEMLNIDCPTCKPNQYVKQNNITQYKELIESFDYEGNGHWTPEMITLEDNYLFHFKCEYGHKYSRTLSNVFSKNDKTSVLPCPVCTEKHCRAIKSVNDFATLNPYLMNFWDYDLNENSPSLITNGVSKQCYFKCSCCGKSSLFYIFAIAKSQSTLCKTCMSYQTSFGEQAIYYYLKDIAKNRYKFHKKEIDIYIEKLNIGIEFNGDFWHKDRLDKDLAKELYLSHYMKMFYVLEDNENKIINNKIYFNKQQNYKENLEWAIKELFKILNLDITVDLQKDSIEIYKRFSSVKFEFSIGNKFPYIKKCWIEKDLSYDNVSTTNKLLLKFQCPICKEIFYDKILNIYARKYVCKKCKQ